MNKIHCLLCGKSYKNIEKHNLTMSHKKREDKRGIGNKMEKQEITDIEEDFQENLGEIKENSGENRDILFEGDRFEIFEEEEKEEIIEKEEIRDLISEKEIKMLKKKLYTLSLKMNNYDLKNGVVLNERGKQIRNIINTMNYDELLWNIEEIRKIKSKSFFEKIGMKFFNNFNIIVKNQMGFDNSFIEDQNDDDIKDSIMSVGEYIPEFLCDVLTSISETPLLSVFMTGFNVFNHYLKSGENVKEIVEVKVEEEIKEEVKDVKFVKPVITDERLKKVLIDHPIVKGKSLEEHIEYLKKKNIL